MAHGPRRPRVLLCVDEFRSGGVTTVMIDFARLLGDRFDIEFAAFRAGPWLDRVQETGLPVHIVPLRRMPFLMRRFDLVHSHYRGLGVLAFATGLRRRSIEHVHNLYDDRPLLSFRGRTVVAVSNAVAESLRERYPRLASSALVVVRNAAPPSLLERPHPRPRPTPLVAVAVGRLVEQKDPLTFLNLARALRDADPDFTAVWVGEGPLSDEFTARLEQLGLQDVVSWEEMPERARALELIATAGVLVLTSRWEGFPMVTLEAAALGTPIATTECGDITEDVDRIGMGVVLRGDRTDPQVITQWATSVEGLWADERTWLASSDRAKQAAATEFSMAHLKQQMTEVYRAALTDRRRRGRARALPRGRAARGRD